MKRRLHAIMTLLLCLYAFTASAQTRPASLQGVVTDPSGAAVPGAMVQLVGPRGQQRQATGTNGNYSFASVPAGKYTVRFIAKGFTVGERKDLELNASITLDHQLTIEANAQVLNVEDEANNAVNVDPNSGGGAITFGQAQIDALSDDPDILQQQLLALSGTVGGPNGGQVYVDGFSGAQLPPKSSIQEIRVNSNPYSPENEYPGGSGIQIITKPGSSNMIHGGINTNYNKEALNSRSPLLTQAKRPQYKQEGVFGNLSGALIKNKASWSLNAGGNSQVENAFIYATILDDSLNPAAVNQTILQPRSNWNFQPRIDYAINSKHTLTASVFNGHFHADNQGAGDFGLASRAYQNKGYNLQVQISETAILNAHMVSDTKFQWFRNRNSSTGDNSTPSLVVPGAFTGGGAQVGNSGNLSDSFEGISTTSYGFKAHTFRWGGRLRQGVVDNISVNNFGGTYTFQGGTGPLLDSANQPVPGTSVPLTALEVYRRTLLFRSLGDKAIRELGGGARQFSISAGQPSINVRQFDASMFLVDDWRARPNLTFSYGLRYEIQNNISDLRAFAPRIALAWIPKVHGKQGKTAIRAGMGGFYSRIPLQVTQNAERFNGVTQQSFLILNPSFFPSIPSAATLATAKLPQQLQLVDSSLRAAQTWQASIGADRPLGKLGRISMNYSVNRGIHLQRVRNINAPIAGLFPFGDPQLRMLTEGTGFSRTQQFTVTPTLNYKKMFVAGFYTLSYGKSDAEGQPADPYNLRAEWGPSSYGDIRHRVMVLFSSPLPTKRLSKFSTTTQFTAQSGAPYTLTSGRDLNGDSILSERPGLVPGVSASSCTGGTLLYKADFGCFNLAPAPGTAIGRNTARGPRQVNLMIFQLSRSWILNPDKEVAGGKEAMVTVPGPGGTMVTVPASMVGNMGGAAGAGKRKYNLTFSLMARNPLNHPTYTAPSGDLSSPYFGVYRSLANNFGPSGSTFNRQVMLQLRLNF